MKATINAKGTEITVISKGDENDYISLTDLARYKNKSNPGDVIIKWMSNKSSFDFYCLWEELFNDNFKLAESREFKIESGSHSCVMSPSKWINLVNAAGFICKRGRYDSGTYAHSDIALEFASWLSPEFKLYLIKEFESKFIGANGFNYTIFIIFYASCYYIISLNSRSLITMNSIFIIIKLKITCFH